MPDDITTKERREEIFNIIKKNERAEVPYLKKKFNVSSVTIGKDLMYLESQGLIERQFGYAEIRRTELFSNRGSIKNYEKKKKIAKHAVEYIEDGMSVFFYMSSTILTMVRLLKDLRNINIVTNSIEVAHDIALNLNVKTIVLGGYYSHENVATFGEEAVTQFEKYNIDKIFFTSNGISANGGLTIDEPFEKDLNSAMVAYPSKKYLLAEGDKIGRTSFVKFAPVNAIDVLITDSSADKKECELIASMGVEVIIV